MLWMQQFSIFIKDIFNSMSSVLLKSCQSSMILHAIEINPKFKC